MARLIKENGRGARQVQRADGTTNSFPRTASWRVRYVVTYPDGSRALRSKMAGRRTEALLIRDEAGRLERLTRTGTIDQEGLGQFLRFGLLTDDDYLRLGGRNLDLDWDEVLAAYVESSDQRCTFHTHENNVARAQRIVAFLRARTPVSKVGDDDIRAYLSSRANVSAKTKKHELDVARRLLDHPVRKGVLRSPLWDHLLSANPARRVDGFPSHIRPVRFPRALTFEEDVRLLEILKRSHKVENWVKAAILIGRFYGLRRGEIQYLTHADLDGPKILIQAKRVLPDLRGSRRRGRARPGDRIEVLERRETADRLKDGWWRPKDHEARAVYIPGSSSVPEGRPMARIRSLIARSSSGRFAFGGGHTLHRDVISAKIQRVLNLLGPDLTPKSLRHTFATWLLSRGVNIVRVKELMGHEDLRTTLIYTHLTNQEVPGDILDLL